MADYSDLSIDEINELYNDIIEMPNVQMISAGECSHCWATYTKSVCYSCED